jgi:hypothetical protein
MSAPRTHTGEPSGQRSEPFGSARKVVAAAVLSVVILAFLLLVILGGTTKWVSDCYSTHAGERVRWTFPNGCEIEYGETYLTVGT